MDGYILLIPSSELSEERTNFVCPSPNEVRKRASEACSPIYSEVYDFQGFKHIFAERGGRNDVELCFGGV